MSLIPSASAILKGISKGRNKWIYRLIGLYPPFLGTGISLKEVNADLTRFVVQMKMRFYNRNAYGYHFGGSLFSMCDPFFIMIIHAHFGDDYIIWDQSASIQFRSPGKGRVTAVFEIPKSELMEMQRQVDAAGKKSYAFSTKIIDSAGKTVADVKKEIYIRKKS